MRDFLLGTDGSVAAMAGIVVGVITVATVGAVEYQQIVNSKQSLQSSTDAAILVATRAYLHDEGIDAATRSGETAFAVNCANGDCGAAPAVTFDFNADHVLANAQAGFDGAILSNSAFLGQIIEADSRVDIGEDGSGTAPVDLHFAMDMSASMNIPDDPQDIVDFSEMFDPWGGGSTCSFACHVPIGASGEQGITGLGVARQNGIYLREDRMRDDMSGLIGTITDSGARAALYAFGESAWTEADLTADLESVVLAARTVAGTSDTTNFRAVIDHLVETTAATRDSDRPQVAVIMTDGYDHERNNPDAFQPIVVSDCDLLKEQGTEIAIVNLEYPQASDLSGSPDINHAEALRTEVYAALEACASPDRYYTADNGEAIREALDAAVEDVMETHSTTRALAISR